MIDPQYELKCEVLDHCVDENYPSPSIFLRSDQTNLNEELNTQYKTHLQVSAELGEGFPCGECQLILKTRKVWMEHMKGIHRNRTYSCPICEKVFRWRSARNRHVVNIHHKRAAQSGNTSPDLAIDTVSTEQESGDMYKENRRPSPDQRSQGQIKMEEDDIQSIFNIAGFASDPEVLSVTSKYPELVILPPDDTSDTESATPSKPKPDQFTPSNLKVIGKTPLKVPSRKNITPKTKVPVSGIDHSGVQAKSMTKYSTPLGAKMSPNRNSIPSSSPKVSTPSIKVITVSDDSGSLDFPCDRCMLVFSSDKELAAHRRRAHLNQNFPCPHCDARFSWKSAKYRHINRFHRGKNIKDLNVTDCSSTEARYANENQDIVTCSAPATGMLCASDDLHIIPATDPGTKSRPQGVLRECQLGNCSTKQEEFPSIPGTGLFSEDEMIEFEEEFIMTSSGGSTE